MPTTEPKLTSAVEYRAPDPCVDLHKSQHFKPPPQRILLAHAPSDLIETLEIDVEVTKRGEDRDGLLDGTEAVERPFAVDWAVRQYAQSRGADPPGSTFPRPRPRQLGSLRRLGIWALALSPLYSPHLSSQMFCVAPMRSSPLDPGLSSAFPLPSLLPSSPPPRSDASPLHHSYPLLPTSHPPARPSSVYSYSH
jgi:hypothetical protein